MKRRVYETMLRAGLVLASLLFATFSRAQDAPTQQTESTSLATAAPSGVIELEVGNLSLSSKEMLPWFTSEVQAFMAANPNIRVTIKNFNQPSRSKELLIDTPGLAANVIGLSSWSGYEAAHLGANQVIVPVDQFLPDNDFHLDAFYPNLLPPVQYGGKTWGVPFVADSLLLLAYRTDLFAAAGLSAPPKTWEECIDYSNRLAKDTDGDGQLDVFGLAIVESGKIIRQLYLTFLAQRGANLFTENGIDVNSSAVREALQQLPELLKLPSFAPLFMVGDGTARVRPTLKPTSEYAMEIVTRKRLAEIRQDKRFALAPLPCSGRDVAANKTTYYLAVRKSTPEKEKASWRLVKWLTRKDAPLQNAPIGYPCRKDVIERKDFAPLCAQNCGNWDLVYTSQSKLFDAGPFDLIGREFAFERFNGYYILALAGIVDPYQSHISVDGVYQRTTEEANKFIRKVEAPNTRTMDIYN